MLEVDVVLDVAAPGRHRRALARLGDLDVLGARRRLEIGGQLGRLVADARLLDRVARLGLQVLVAILRDRRQRLADGGVAVLAGREMLLNELQATQQDRDRHDRSATPMTTRRSRGRHPLPLGARRSRGRGAAHRPSGSR